MSQKATEDKDVTKRKLEMIEEAFEKASQLPNVLNAAEREDLFLPDERCAHDSDESRPLTEAEKNALRQDKRESGKILAELCREERLKRETGSAK